MSSRSIFAFVLLFPVCLCAQVENRVFESQYKTLYSAYCENPTDVTNLLNLTDFYIDRNNPLRNFIYAKKYMRMARTQYLSLVGNDKYYRELNKLMKKGVTIDSIRSMDRQLDEAVISYIRHASVLGRDEIEQLLGDYGQNQTIRDLLYQHRIVIEYSRAVQSENVDSCYQFMKQYAGTNLAYDVDTVITSILRHAIDTSADILSVNAMASRYPECVSLQRLAYKRCAQIAYDEVCAVNTIEAYRHYLDLYPGSDKYMEVLQMIEDLEAGHLVGLEEADEIVDFMRANNNSPLYLAARKRLLDKIFLNHDVRAIELYLEHFKMDSAYTDVFEFYYQWHSVEGNLAPLASFHSRYPEFPFRTVLESDLQKAVVVDDVFLMEPFSESKLSEYSKYLYRLTGKNISFVVLQRTLQCLISNKDWQGALNRLESFSLSFEDHCLDKYTELRKLLSAPYQSQRRLSVEVTPGYNMAHPIVHPESGYLYYAKKGSNGGGPMCAASVSGKNYKWKSVGPLEMDYNIMDSCRVVPFCFFDNGAKMLLGANGDIWVAELNVNKWRVVQKLPPPVNTEYLETDAYMMPDGSGLLLASDRPGGYNVQHSGAYFHGDTAAATDLYFVPFADGSWGDAVNLGKNINTIYCEKSPILSKNNRTLYFVSDGRSGLGYGDVYCATRTDVDDWTSWSLPQNAGKEVNTGFDEASVSFSLDESRLFVLSNSLNGRYGCYSTPSWHNPNTFSYFVDLAATDLPFPVCAYVVTGGSLSSVDSLMIDDKLEKLAFDGPDERYLVFKSRGDFFIPSVQLPSKTDSVELSGSTVSEWASSSEEILFPLISVDSPQLGLNAFSRLQFSELVCLLKANSGYAVDVLVDVNGEHSAAYDMSVDLGLAIKEFMVSEGLDGDRVRLMPYGSLRVAETAGSDRVSVRFLKLEQ